MPVFFWGHFSNCTPRVCQFWPQSGLCNGNKPETCLQTLLPGGQAAVKATIGSDSPQSWHLHGIRPLLMATFFTVWVPGRFVQGLEIITQLMAMQKCSVKGKGWKALQECVVPTVVPKRAYLVVLLQGTKPCLFFRLIGECKGDRKKSTGPIERSKWGLKVQSST